MRLNELKAQIKLQKVQTEIEKLEQEILKTQEALKADKVERWKSCGLSHRIVIKS